MKILIAEDESDIRDLLKIQLEEEGFVVCAAKDGVEALCFMKNNEIELAILDVMMPRLDGFNLLRKIRETNHIPVIFLTARGEEMDKVLGLGIGADDYLVKPFSMQELIARVYAQIRRNKTYITNQKPKKCKIEYGDLVLDKDGCCLYKNNKLVELNAKEFRLLECLMGNKSNEASGGTELGLSIAYKRSKEGGKGSLVNKGIYKFIRHPQYTGLLLLSFGMMIEWVTLPLLILYPVMIFMYVRLAKREETDMINEFGEEYLNYRKETKMFIPFII